MSDVICCGVIEQVREMWDLPFEDSLLLLPKTVAKTAVNDGEEGGSEFALICRTVVTLMRRTKAGNISSKTSGIFMNFCPFCGKKWPENEEVTELVGTIDHTKAENA